MSRFSPSDAALEGFRLTRAHPLPVLAWGAVRLAFGIFSLIVLVQSDWTATTIAINAEAHAAAPNAAKVLALFRHVLPAMALMTVVALAFYAVAYTAVLRAVLRPADNRFLYMRLSMDEARQFVLALMIFVLFFLYVCVVNVLAMGLIQASKGLGGAALALQILVVMGMVVAFIYPTVRLSLAPSLTFAEGRIVLFGAWPLTRGRFWPIFGTFVLALVLAAVVGLLATVIFIFVVGALGAAQHGFSDLGAVFGVMQQDEATLAALTQPIALAKLVFGAFLNTLGYIILFSPAPAIFRALADGRPASAPQPSQAKPGKPWG